jgi:hypothetical protein
MVGIAPVPPDRIPGPLPPGLEFPIVITVQTSGATNFDLPVSVCFPNLPDPSTGAPLLPGEKNYLYSFNHDTGNFEPVGFMTVSADGRLICTDRGVGILAPGWHGSGPVPVEPDDPCAAACCVGGSGGGGGGGGDGGDGGGAGSRGPCIFDCSPARGNACILETCLRLEYECDWCDKNSNNPRARTRRQRVERSDGAWYPYCVRRAREKRNERAKECDNQFGLGCPQSFSLDCEDGNCCPLDAEPGCFPGQGGGGAGADSVRQEIRLLFVEIYALMAPFGFDEELPEDVAAQIDDLLASADALADGNLDGLITRDLLEDEQRIAAGEARSAFRLGGNAPAYPVLYLAEVLRADGSVLALRGRTGPGGRYSLFIPRDGEIRRVAFYDPRTRRLGMEEPLLTATPPAVMPPMRLGPVPADLEDFDRDGLADVVEFIYGTHAVRADTDADGINDGAEVEQGTDPLDGRPALTGIIATADTPGAAQDVCAFNDLVFVADGSAGLSVFSALNGRDPTTIARISTPGTARAVACSDGGLVALACDDAGLVIVDITDPPAARILHQIFVGGSALSVAAAGGIAYVGLSSGRIAAVDLASGAVLEHVTIGEPIVDVGIEGEQLHALTPNALHALSLNAGRVIRGGSASSPFGSTFVALPNRRLFVGGGIAYAVHGRGYNTFDLTRPPRPVLIRAGSTGQIGWRHLVLNGSGLGVAAVAVNSNSLGDAWLYDVRDPQQTDVFLTAFTTPGDASAISLYNGLAYVADSTGGMHVINYLAYDTLGVPPRITLSASFPLDPAEAEEGKSVRVTAAVDDDVQVRNVEFHLDGVRVATDGNFPFELRFKTPLRSRQPSFTLRAAATDTGGNSTSTATIVLTLTPDVTPPRILAVTPPDSGFAGSLNVLAASCNEPLDPSTIGPSAFQLFSAGPDGVAGTPDDAAVPGGAVSYRGEVDTAVLSFASPLPPGLYRALLSPPLADLAGNVIEPPFVWTFRALSFADADQDGVPDDVEPLLALDPQDPDTDDDGLHDGSEDFDNDGLSNTSEIVLGADPRDPDSDGDGVLDGAEDADADALADGREVELGTDPFLADSDRDGWPDDAELDAGSDPLRALSRPPSIHIAQPRLSIPVLSLEPGPQTGVTVAAPRVSIAFPGVGQPEGAATSISVGKPPVSVKINP